MLWKLPLNGPSLTSTYAYGSNIDSVKNWTNGIEKNNERNYKKFINVQSNELQCNDPIYRIPCERKEKDPKLLHNYISRK